MGAAENADGAEGENKDGEAAEENKEEKPGSPDGDALKPQDEGAAEGGSRGGSRLSRIPSERIIEQDQEDKAAAIGNRVNLPQGQTPYMIFQMNEYAARAHRTDFIDQVVSKVFEYFQEHRNAKKEIAEAAEKEALETDNAFIASTCDEYELPCLEYQVHAPDYE